MILPHHRSVRLTGYDYSQAGAHFVTICTYQRRCTFGEIVDGQMRLSHHGTIVEEEWLRSSEVHPWLALDELVIMPNQLHGIVVIAPGSQPSGFTGNASVRQFGRTPRLRAASLGSFVGGFKATVTRRINIKTAQPSGSIWQRNYREHIIRGETELQTIREYFANNPAN